MVGVLLFPASSDSVICNRHFRNGGPKHGPEVEVLAPESLQVEVIDMLSKALKKQRLIAKRV